MAEAEPPCSGLSLEEADVFEVNPLLMLADAESPVPVVTLKKTSHEILRNLKIQFRQTWQKGCLSGPRTVLDINNFLVLFLGQIK